MILDKFTDRELILLPYGVGAVAVHAKLQILYGFFKGLGSFGVAAIVILLVLRKFCKKCFYKIIQRLNLSTSNWIFL